MPPKYKSQRRVDQLLGIPTTRPALAVAAFMGPFAITLFMFWLDSDHFLVVVPCVSFAFSSTLLCIQLLGGNIIPYKWLLFVTLCCAVYSGYQWYVFVSLAAGVALWLVAMDRYVGYFAPLFASSSRQQRIFHNSHLPQTATSDPT